MKSLPVPWSKVAICGMVIPPLIGNPYNGYINPYYKVDDHPYHRKTMGVSIPAHLAVAVSCCQPRGDVAVAAAAAAAVVVADVAWSDLPPAAVAAAP